MDEVQLKKLLKAQLANMARQKGIWVASQNTKDAIIRKILSGGGYAPAPAPGPANNLSKMLKPQLMNLARQRGIWVTSKNTKNVIIQKIRAGKNQPAPAPVPKPLPAPVPKPLPAPAPKRNRRIDEFANHIREANTLALKKLTLAAAVRQNIVKKNSNNYKKLKNLIPPDYTINNLYTMNLNKLRKEYGFMYKMNNNTSRNTMVRGILSARNVNIMGGGAISNSLINAPSAKGVCRSGRLQITGTCWFQALMNPFLLSDLGRDILATKLAQFKASNNMKKWNNINACPYKLSGAYFWSYIDYKLKEDYTNLNNYKKVMKGELYTNERLIRNIKLKNNNKDINGGSLPETYRFFNEIFKDDYGWHNDVNEKYIFKITGPQSNYKISKVENHPLVCVFTPETVNSDNIPPEIIEKNNYKYKLFGATLSAWGKKNSNEDKVGGHSMTGYLCGDGKYMFYDSNSIRTNDMDWTTKKFWDEDFRKYMKRYYKIVTQQNGRFFYVRIGGPVINNTTKSKPNTPKPSKPWYKRLFK